MTKIKGDKGPSATAERVAVTGARSASGSSRVVVVPVAGPSFLVRDGLPTVRHSGNGFAGGSVGGDGDVAALLREVADLKARLQAQEHEIATLKAERAIEGVGADYAGSSDAAPLREGSVDAMLAPFMLSAEAATQRLADDPTMLDGAAFGERIYLSRQAVDERRKRGELLGLRQAKRKVWYPLSQLDAKGRVIDGVADLLKAFDGDGWSAHEFLVSPQVGLDGLTGREALLAGRKDEVLTVVRGIREGAFG